MKRLWVILFLLSLLTSPVSAQDFEDAPELPASIVILSVEGTITYARPGWAVPQPLVAGTLISPTDDFIYPQGDVTLLAMCPSGSVVEFLPGQLQTNDVLACDSGAQVIGSPGMQRVSIQRGGRQDPTIPYLISPRATVLREPTLNLVWNPIVNVHTYSLTVRADGNPIRELADIAPEAVQVGGQAVYTVSDLTLQEEVAYTVDICVDFDDGRPQKCTNQPGWESTAVLAFYYASTPELNAQEQNLMAELGENTPTSLYARAVLLSQPVIQTEIAPLGVYQEAIKLCERIISDHPTSALASSPELYNLLGELYRRVDLKLSANAAFATAAQLANPNTASAATATLGTAITTPDDRLGVSLYDQALDNYAEYLTPDAFTIQFEMVCKEIGDLCLDLSRCQDNAEQCLAWYEERLG
ncbi:MAG: hypothetical protein H6673_00145 [Anaerolineales bacterium]|nr:hypothetical protein [Anaerolineales bacterium]